MANTYIHTLPDALATLDPASYTILDYQNIYNEYTTAKLTLSSLADYVNDAYILTEEHLGTKRATSWVNANSSNMLVQTLIINGSSTNLPLHIQNNINDSSTILLRNSNSQPLALAQFSFRNSNSASNFRVGILGENYNQVFWTIGDSKNDGYIFGESQNVVIGTVGFDKDLILFTGGPFIGNERLVAKGDGTGYVGINTRYPNHELSVNGGISAKQTVYDSEGNSRMWNSVYSYINSFSSRSFGSTSLVEFISANIVFKTGSVISGPIVTTNSLTGTFAVDELITRRYVDALVFQNNISGNFVPALYYTKTDTDALLNASTQAYSYINTNSSLDLDSRTFVNNNSSNYLGLYSNVFNASGKWESVYFYVNQTSALEEDQNEVVNFVFSNSSNIREVNSYVNTTSASLSANINEIYSFTSQNSSLNFEVRTYVNQNSSTINNTTSLVNNNAGEWNQAYSYVAASSAQDTLIDTLVNSNSANWNQSYTLYSNNSGTYTTYNYVNNNFLPLSGGKVIGNLFATNYGVGNTVVVAGTLGTLTRKMQIFDVNGNSLGFIPVYGSID